MALPSSNIRSAAASFRDGPQMRSRLQTADLQSSNQLNTAARQGKLETSKDLNSETGQGQLEGGKGINTDIRQGRLEGSKGSNGLKDTKIETGGGFSDTSLETSGGFTDTSLETSGGFNDTTLEGSSGLETSGGLKDVNLQAGGGLHNGKQGGQSGRVKSAVKKAPVFVEIICGSPVSGSIQLDVEWEYDEWGRLASKTNVHRAMINERIWTQENWGDFANEEGSITSAGFYECLALGTLIAATPDKLVWHHKAARHSLGCEVKFDKPDLRGEIIRERVISLTLTDGSTTDSPTIEPASSHSVFPDYARAYLSLTT